MTVHRRRVVWIGALAIAALCLYPPWIAFNEFYSIHSYGWVWRAPPEWDSLRLRAELDIGRLLAQCMLVVVFAAAAGWAWPPFDMATWKPRILKFLLRMAGFAVLGGIALEVALEVPRVIPPQSPARVLLANRLVFWVSSAFTGAIIVSLIGDVVRDIYEFLNKKLTAPPL